MGRHHDTYIRVTGGEVKYVSSAVETDTVRRVAFKCSRRIVFHEILIFMYLILVTTLFDAQSF